MDSFHMYIYTCTYVYMYMYLVGGEFLYNAAIVEGLLFIGFSPQYHITLPLGHLHRQMYITTDIQYRCITDRQRDKQEGKHTHMHTRTQHTHTLTHTHTGCLHKNPLI